MTTEYLLSKRYRFSGNNIPAGLSGSQRDARELFLMEIHSKRRYICVEICPFCGHRSFKKISEIEKRALPSDVVICELCDGCFKSEIMDSEANRLHYESISYLLRGKRVGNDFMEGLFEKRVKEFAWPRYRFLAHFLDLIPGRDLIAEFGCNDGANLMPWKEKGFDVIGIDMDPNVIALGRKKGLELIRGDFMQYDFARRRPSLIILSHVLEHVSDVNATLDRLAGVIDPDGYLFIESPGIRVHGLRDPLSYFDIEHNYNFDLGSLCRLLASRSLRVLYGDENVRVICTPSAFAKPAIRKGGSASFSGAVAAACRKCASFVSPKNWKLQELLIAGENNDLRMVLLSKLRALYFRCYYHSVS